MPCHAMPCSKWGAVRAAMGHPEPWEINFMAIGNEVGVDGCGLVGGWAQRMPGGGRAVGVWWR